MLLFLFEYGNEQKMSVRTSDFGKRHRIADVHVPPC